MPPAVNPLVAVSHIPHHRADSRDRGAPAQQPECHSAQGTQGENPSIRVPQWLPAPQQAQHPFWHRDERPHQDRLIGCHSPWMPSESLEAELTPRLLARPAVCSFQAAAGALARVGCTGLAALAGGSGGSGSEGRQTAAAAADTSPQPPLASIFRPRCLDAAVAAPTPCLWAARPPARPRQGSDQRAAEVRGGHQGTPAERTARGEVGGFEKSCRSPVKRTVRPSKPPVRAAGQSNGASGKRKGRLSSVQAQVKRSKKGIGPSAAAAAEAAAQAETIDLHDPDTVIVTSAETSARFCSAAAGALSCSIGLLLSDAQSGTQTFSTARPLTKLQERRAKKCPASQESAQPARLRGMGVHLLQDDRCEGGPMFFLPLEGAGGSEVAALVHLLLSSGQPIICYDLQGLLRELRPVLDPVQPAACLCAVDPRLLAWLHEPQLVQRDERELERYGLPELARRYRLPGMLSETAATELPPLRRLHYDLQSGQRGLIGGCSVLHYEICAKNLEMAARLALAAQAALAATGVPATAADVEMRVAVQLAALEGTGIGFDAAMVRRHEASLQALCGQLQAAAHVMAGHPFSLASSVQLAAVLYDDLGLPPPTSNSGRGQAKSHTPTDEATLRSLVHLHALPSLMLSWRAAQNMLTHWISPTWVQVAAAEAERSGGGGGRVRCSWNQCATATGRLSSSAPNLQAVTKYEVGARLAAAGSRTRQDVHAPINVRDAFVAREGCVLLCADYSQVELRILAHLSGDPALRGLLRLAGTAGDAFSMIAATWLHRDSGAEVEAVTSEERAKAKTVTYGIIYGLTAQGLARGSAGLSITLPAARALIASFLDHFPGVRAFVERTKATARAEGEVRTLAGRRRPIKAINSSDQRERAEAERKAVNSVIQGSAADLIKAAMCCWAVAAAEEKPPHPPRDTASADFPQVRLLAQIHDELMLEVDTRCCSLQGIAARLKALMEGVAQLSVPLIVNIQAGPRWGCLTPL